MLAHGLAWCLLGWALPVGSGTGTLARADHDEAVADAMYSEDHTMWGLYNALTRLGRDSMDLTYKTLFERAGHYLSLNPQVVLEELEAAAPSGLS